MQPEDVHGLNDPPDPIGAATPSLHPIYSRPQGFVSTAPPPQVIENEILNTTGEHEAAPVEVEEMRWHWGAFLSGWVWCFFNGLPAWAIVILAVWIALIAVIWPSTGVNVIVAVPLLLFALAMQTYLGLNGHQLAWQNRRFPSGFPQFQSVQRAWSQWSMWVFVIVAPVAILVLEYHGPPTAPALAPLSSPAVDAAQTYPPTDSGNGSDSTQPPDTTAAGQNPVPNPQTDQNAGAVPPSAPAPPATVSLAGQSTPTSDSAAPANTEVSQPTSAQPQQNSQTAPGDGSAPSGSAVPPPASAVSAPAPSQQAATPSTTDAQQGQAAGQSDATTPAASGASGAN